MGTGNCTRRTPIGCEGPEPQVCRLLLPLPARPLRRGRRRARKPCIGRFENQHDWDRSTGNYRRYDEPSPLYWSCALKAFLGWWWRRSPGGRVCAAPHTAPLSLAVCCPGRHWPPGRGGTLYLALCLLRLRLRQGRCDGGNAGGWPAGASAGGRRQASAQNTTPPGSRLDPPMWQQQGPPLT